MILWESPANVFVIDGGHRLSVLRAWVEDDYGDGPISLVFFNREISRSQKKAAETTRKLVNSRIGSFNHFQSKAKHADIDPEERRRIQIVISRAIPIQWVSGNADQAQDSFFKINTAGTPLDAIEELLLRNRKKPIPICARAILRSGTGHKYWSSYPEELVESLESKAREIHALLFDPEVERPVPLKTLELPLGGSKGIRTALKTLLDFCVIATRNGGSAPSIAEHPDDPTGESTLEAIKKVHELSSRITGNQRGSLGLHPAIYFYGPTGHHQAPMFMGTAMWVKRQLINNDKEAFRRFTRVRSKLERALIDHKATIALLLQGYVSSHRVSRYADFIASLVKHLEASDGVSGDELVQLSGVTGRILIKVADSHSASNFSDDAKSAAFMRRALEGIMTCTICGGYVDAAKSVSYDHIHRKSAGGDGNTENCDLVHPYCDNAMKG